MRVVHLDQTYGIQVKWMPIHDVTYPRGQRGKLSSAASSESPKYFSALRAEKAHVSVRCLIASPTYAPNIHLSSEFQVPLVASILQRIMQG